MEVSAHRAKGWHCEGHNRSEITDWDDGGAALRVWEMGTWWDWWRRWVTHRACEKVNFCLD